MNKPKSYAFIPLSPGAELRFPYLEIDLFLDLIPWMNYSDFFFFFSTETLNADSINTNSYNSTPNTDLLCRLVGKVTNHVIGKLMFSLYYGCTMYLVVLYLITGILLFFSRSRELYICNSTSGFLIKMDSIWNVWTY